MHVSSECGRSYAAVAKDHMAMRLYVSDGNGANFQDRIVFLMKRQNVVLEDKNISDVSD